jgi:uncharacterized protein
MGAATVEIHYHRPPDRVQRFEQEVVVRTPEWTATYLHEAKIERPVQAGGTVILEPGSPVVWFTYPGEWHDVGRFHLAGGRFTGYYANILTPVSMAEDRWETTDLFLDVWLPPEGDAMLLDEEELAEAEERGWVDGSTAARARRHAAELIEAAGRGAWPPEHVRDWTLERARARLGYASLGSSTEADTSRFRSR